MLRKAKQVSPLIVFLTGTQAPTIHTVCREAAILALREVVSEAGRDADVKALAGSVKSRGDTSIGRLEYVRSAGTEVREQSYGETRIPRT